MESERGETGRPCARCIKKGCPEDCVDGARKKAKYLQEVPDERESLSLSLSRIDNQKLEELIQVFAIR